MLEPNPKNRWTRLAYAMGFLVCMVWFLTFGAAGVWVLVKVLRAIAHLLV